MCRCHLHYHTCSHSAPHIVGFTNLLAKSKGARCAASRSTVVRMACMHASCAAKVGMERRLAAPDRKSNWCQQLINLLHNLLLQSPREVQCSYLASVARVKVKMQSMVLQLPPPSVDSLDEFLVDLQQPCSSSGAQTAEALADLSLLPHPNAATSEEVEERINVGSKRLINISTNMPPSVGGSILWRSIKSGPSGQPPRRQSTSMQRFATRRLAQMESCGAMLTDLQ